MENEKFLYVMMGIAAIAGCIVCRGIYNSGFFFLAGGLAAAVTVLEMMIRAQTSGGQIAYAFLGLLLSPFAAIICQYGVMLFWWVGSLIIKFGIMNSIRVLVALPFLVIGLILYKLMY